MAIKAIKGMNDILPAEAWKWQFVENTARRVFANFGYVEIRPPILEKTELFARSIGETTDIVEKEMYTFPDRNSELLTLRPEATASVVRAYIEHALHLQPTMRKLYTIGPMFRHERPQKGRYRQFHQIDVEAFAIDDPMIDAEVIYMLVAFLDELGIRQVELHLNSLGCSNCRQPFRASLSSYLDETQESLCADCRRRKLKNPLRVFDCKVPACRETLERAPKLLEFLCEECAAHFQSVSDYLRSLGLAARVDPYMVRGLDYYTKTTFEVLAEHLGSQNAVGGGGRYDGLMKMLGGPDLPGIGFAIGMERLIMLLPGEGAREVRQVDLFVACLGDEARRFGFSLVQQMRRADVHAEADYGNRSLKAQMRLADKLRAHYVLIVGEDEIARQKGTLRDMRQKTQVEVPFETMKEQLLTLCGQSLAG
ncbi:MAG: histidine--tRNA ligase [Deltaproteobacteria bacterium]|nr:histidine--tRNA ligase [Deltaproteobacteria bacterium]